MDWKEIFKEGVELVLATYSQESGPHAIVIQPNIECWGRKSTDFEVSI
jgi:hypothetical protein